MDVRVSVLRVFCAPDGSYGNPLGVVLDGSSVEGDDRQAFARYLGYPETVFIDDPQRGRIQIFTPEVELLFAGHPSVGSAWLLAEEGYSVESLRPPAGRCPVRRNSEGTYISARPEWSPRFELREYGTPSEVDALDPGSSPAGWFYAWAWADRDAGIVRARSFVPEAGITEDEATGAAAVLLCDHLDREISIHQGSGSRIQARPIEGGMIEIGGHVVVAEPE